MKCITCTLFLFVMFSALWGEYDNSTYEFIDGTPVLSESEYQATLLERQMGGWKIPSSGVFKICVIFVDWAGETEDDTDWPLNQLPTCYNYFIEPNVFSGSWPHDANNNMSEYMHTMSNGNFQLIGDCYHCQLPQSYIFQQGSIGIAAANHDVLQTRDSVIDYSQYDNWTKNAAYSFSNTPDGVVDFIIIAYRSLFSTYFGVSYTGIASLNYSYTTQDGVTVSAEKGITQGSGVYGYDSLKNSCLHETAHLLFSGGPYGHNGRIVNLGVLSGNQVGFNSSKGMCAYELERLGWLNYNVVTPSQDTGNGVLVTLPDMMTSFMAVKVPTNDADKFYVIENRQKLSDFDGAFDVGIYIFRASNNIPLNSRVLFNPRNTPEPCDGNLSQDGSFDGFVDVLCADGRWNFTNNLDANHVIDDYQNIRIHKTVPNIKGYDERNYCGTVHVINNTQNVWWRYDCRQSAYYPWYEEDNIGNTGASSGDAWGDNNDAFDTTYNNVFSRWSNPGIDQDWATANFSVEIVSENPVNHCVTLRIRFTHPEYAPPSRALALDGSYSSTDNQVHLSWVQTPEPDFNHYKVQYRHWSEAAGVWHDVATPDHASSSRPMHNHFCCGK